MSTFSSIPIPKIDSLEIKLSEPDTVELKGTIALQDPGREIGPFFKALHAKAVEQALPFVRIDVSRLSFINSSAIRLFVDWAIAVRDEKAHRYVLKFLIDRQVTWQRTSFAALVSLTKDVLSVEQVQ
jgi:hypothetical protein